MSHYYYYSYSSDFLGHLNPAQLHQEITYAGTIGPQVLGIDIVGDEVSILFNEELSEGEQTLLNAFVSAHRPIVATVAPYYVTKIKEETTDTGENFVVEGVDIIGNTGPGVVTNNIISWPINMSTLQFNVRTSDDHQDSIINCFVAPNTIIGYLTASCVAGATGLYVSQTVVDHIMVGYYLDLFTGYSTENLGRVTSINKTTNRITTEFQPTTGYTAYPVTYVRMTVQIVKNYLFGSAGMYTIGGSKIGGSYLPANTPVHVKYTNNKDYLVKMSVKVEFLY